MKRGELKTVIIGGAAAVFTGLFVGTAGLLLFFWLFVAAGLAFLILMLAVTTDQETRRNTRQPALLAFSLLLLSLAVAVLMIRHKYKLQHEEADRVVSRLEQYWWEKGYYPARLNGVVKPQYIEPWYEVDSGGKQYKLEYWDVMFINTYNSRTKEWMVDD
jgi:hypothetical protein